MSGDRLEGHRILVVEDEMLIALEIEDALRDLGCAIVGPAARLDEALQLAAEEAIEAAILDITIRGGHVYPVAARLAARGIPFLLASGYGNWALPADLQDRPRLTKPFLREDLQSQIKMLCRGAL